MADLSQYDDVFQAAGNEWNVDPTLLRAVAGVESGGNTRAVSPKGAQGLMQIMPDTAKALGIADPNDPVQSIYGAAKYLNTALDQEGSVEDALRNYHGGTGWRQAYGPESRAYVPAVIAQYVALKPQQPDQPQTAAPVSVPQGPVILGDSLASPQGLGGSGVVGASPGAVRAAVGAGVRGNAYQGRDVVLSSGASNAPGDMTNVEGQLQNLKDGNAGSVTLLGVGPGIEAKNPGTNAALQTLADKYGVRFQPLPADQMGPDGVHPTAKGYRTLLAAATPKTATDATPAPTPAPAAPQGQGKAMASDDLPSWLPPAPSAGGAASAPAATAATSDGLPSWLPPAPTATTKAAPDDYTGLAGAPVNEAEAYTGPNISLPTSVQDVRNRLQQGDINALANINQQRPAPLAADSSWWDRLGYTAKEQLLEAAGIAIHGGAKLADMPLAIVQGLSEGTGGVQIDPRTNALSLTPEAQAAGSLGAGGLRFSGPNALQSVPLGTLDRGSVATPTGPISVERLTQAMPPDWRPVAPGEDYLPGANYRMNQATGQREVNQGGPAAPAATPATAAPAGQFLNNQWLRQAGDTGQGYDMGKGGDALVSQVRDALARGDNVQLVADGGRKTIPITSINDRGMMVDDKGQAQGSFPIAADATGREGVRITPGGAGGPQPAGAVVTPPGAAALSPKEVAAYQATAEGNKLLENQRIGEPDTTQYIPKSTPNAAELEQAVTTARELKSLGITSPEASQEAKLAAQANNDARTEYWQDTARSPVDIQKAEADRAAQAEADLKATWANKTDADASAVTDTADAIKASPDGRRPAVRKAVDSVTDELKDANGNLITDPEQLYGVRKHIDDLLSKEGQRETPLAKRATDNLMALKNQLDSVIEQAAPGFKQYLKNFSDASKPIDEMQVLHDAEPGLFKGPGGTMRYSDFQRFMKNVVDMRQAQGVNPYKSISDDTMARLWNLRDDLRRSASAIDLARAVGSDTTPNIIDALKQYGKVGGGAVVDAAASHLFGPAGPMMVRGARAMIAPVTAQRTARAQMNRMQQMLYPQNPLTPPPSP